MARALGFGFARPASSWTDREGSRLSMPRVLVPVVRELFGRGGTCAARRGGRRGAHRGGRDEARGAARPSRGRGSAPAHAFGWTTFEAGALAALAALAVAVLGGLLLRVWIKGGVVTGADGFLVADPLQYLDWRARPASTG